MDILTFLGIADIGCVGVEKRISDQFIFRNIENHLMTQHGVSMAQYYEEFKHSIKIVNLEITGGFPSTIPCKLLKPVLSRRISVSSGRSQYYVGEAVAVAKPAARRGFADEEPLRRLGRPLPLRVQRVPAQRDLRHAQQGVVPREKAPLHGDEGLHHPARSSNGL